MRLQPTLLPRQDVEAARILKGNSMGNLVLTRRENFDGDADQYSKIYLEDIRGELPDIVIDVIKAVGGQARLAIRANSRWNVRRGELEPK